MPTLSALFLYPIKSCGGISLQQATATAFGLKSGDIYDREWMVVDLDGNFVTQREHPKMACITPCLKDGFMELQALDMPNLEIPLCLSTMEQAPLLQVKVWDDVVAAGDCGDVVAAWFSQAIGISCRLVRFHAQASRLANKHWTGGRDAPTHFADGFPILVVSEASLADVNHKLVGQQRSALPMNRFRPNVVLAGVEAFEEDYAATIQIGPVLLQPVKPCPRCTMPAVDQSTGISGPDPLDILQTYRANPKVDGGITFGMNAILLEGENQLLEIGQEVAIELAFGE